MVLNRNIIFSFLACDKACDGCSGDGPDMCNKCAEGFKKKGNMCVGKLITTLLKFTFLLFFVIAWENDSILNKRKTS